MYKRAKHMDYFLHHLYDEVQEKYSLTDDEMDRLIEFIQRFHGEDAGKALKQIRKQKNKKSLEQIIQEVTGRELEMDAVTEMKFDPARAPDAFKVPVNLPLSKDMLIEPHYDGIWND